MKMKQPTDKELFDKLMSSRPKSVPPANETEKERRIRLYTEKMQR